MAKTSELTAEVKLDVSDALKGLKAVQRETKEATQSIRQLESAAEGMNGEVIEEFTVYDSGFAHLQIQSHGMAGTHNFRFRDDKYKIIIKKI